MADRKDEFDKKIGEKEDEFCSKCGKTTSQRWKGNKFRSGLISTTYAYYLRCKECGNETEIYSIEY